MERTIRVGPEPWESADGERLREAQRAELDARYGNDNHEPGAPPSGASVPVFLLARDDAGTALGCGGLRFIDPGSAEIKRMYVVPAARGTGVATAILRGLEDAARSAGVTRLLLETGTAQPDAMRFYEREGYHRIDNFGPYAGAELSVCYARDLP
ncbi:GNAT family N-acetyltransferase [Micromonospora sp. NPDC000089]|uniref:GNAT family N-acetyltransferase n=1 Tax=unclassified Micromonospora TaxID=2617518 RepID=UPI0036846F75